MGNQQSVEDEPRSDVIGLCAETDADKPFLSKLFISTRLQEFAQTGWTRPQIDQFLAQQFETQYYQYRVQFPHAEFNIVTLNRRAIGRFYTCRDEAEVRIIDISLLSEYRGRGLGSIILKQFISDTQAFGLPIRLHVLSSNPALRLYERLGFLVIEEKGIYLSMEKLFN